MLYVCWYSEESDITIRCHCKSTVKHTAPSPRPVQSTWCVPDLVCMASSRGMDNIIIINGVGIRDGKGVCGPYGWG